MEIRFGIQSAEHQSRPVSSQKMINCYLEATPPGSKSPAAVIPSYGIEEFNDITDLKGGSFINGVMYVVGDGGLYSIDSNGAETLLTTFAHAQPAQIIGDAVGNIVIITDGNGYVWNGTTLTQINDVDFPNARWMGLINGYYITSDRNTGYIYSSELTYDPTSWLANDRDNADLNPDNILWGMVDKRELYLFGDKSTEIWYYDAGSNFPFAPVPNGSFNIGIMCEYAAGTIGNSIYFMGNDGIVYELNGYTPVRISTHSIESKIEGFTKSCRCLTWSESGHAMVGFKFAEGTIVYDLSTQLWNYRRTYNSKTWDVDFIINGYGGYYTGGPTLGKLTPDLFTEYGDILRAECQSAAVYNKNNLLPHDRLELIFETGVGDAQVMLEFSDDGGRTWSNEIWEGLGSTGEYAHRVMFYRLGSSRDRVYNYSISDPYRRILISANLNEWS